MAQFQKELIIAFVQRIERARYILVKNKEIISDNDAMGTLRDGFIDPGGCKQALSYDDDNNISWTQYSKKCIRIVNEKSKDDNRDRLMNLTGADPNKDKYAKGKGGKGGRGGKGGKSANTTKLTEANTCRHPTCVSKNCVHSKNNCWENHPEKCPDKIKKRRLEENPQQTSNKQHSRGLPKDN
jgi:hypothetical protein